MCTYGEDGEAFLAKSADLTGQIASFNEALTSLGAGPDNMK